MKTPFFTVVLTIIRKDLRAEFRTRELLNAMALFSLLSIIIFSFALELDRNARREAVGGVLWVTIIFSSMMGLNRSMGMEQDNGNQDALLLAPIDRAAIFLGKLTANFIFSLAISLMLLPLMTLLFNFSLFNGWLLLILILGTLGFSSVGTLLAAMTVQTRARESLLPIVMMPMAIPLLLAAVRGTTGILNDSPPAEWLIFPSLLAAVDFIYLIVCYLTFEFVIEE